MGTAAAPDAEAAAEVEDKDEEKEEEEEEEEEGEEENAVMETEEIIPEDIAKFSAGADFADEEEKDALAAVDGAERGDAKIDK
jgi:hypothetical protein